MNHPFAELRANHSTAIANLPDEFTAAGSEVPIAFDQLDAAAPKFTMAPAYSGGLLRVDGFPYPVVADLETLDASADQYPILHLHNSTAGLGHVNRSGLRKTATELSAAGVLSIPGADRQQVIDAQKHGFRWQSSVGLRVDKRRLELIPAGQELRANGRVFREQFPVLFARGALLREISFVPYGGDDNATARLSAKSGTAAMNPELLAFIKAAGKDPATMDAATLAIWADALAAHKTGLQAAAAALPIAQPVPNAQTHHALPAALQAAASQTAPTQQQIHHVLPVAQPVTPSPDVVALQAAMATQAATLERLTAQIANGNRVAELNARAANLDAAELSVTLPGSTQPTNLLAHATAQNWNADQFELEARRTLNRVQAPFAIVQARATTSQALAGALLQRFNIPLDTLMFRENRHYANDLRANCGGTADWLLMELNAAARDEVMNRAHSLRAMSLPDLCREALRLEGHALGNSYDYDGIIRAAMSTHSLANIFTLSFSAQLLAGWDAEEDTTDGWCFHNPDIPNFLDNERTSLIAKTKLSRHAKGGAAKQADAAEDNVEKYKLGRYSAQWILDEIDIINDRFGALDQTPPRELGEAAKRLRPDMVYAILKRNAALDQDEKALFHVDRGNIRYSVDLTDETANRQKLLQEAITAMGNISQRGVPLNLVPDTFIGPRTLSFIIDTLTNSSINYTKEDGDKNVLKGQLPKKRVDSRLNLSHVDPTDDTTIAGSLANFFLIDSRRPPIEVGTRRGASPVPQITNWTKRGEEGKWETGFAVAHDIAAKAIRWQSIQLNTDEAAP